MAFPVTGSSAIGATPVFSASCGPSVDTPFSAAPPTERAGAETAGPGAVVPGEVSAALSPGGGTSGDPGGEGDSPDSEGGGGCASPSLSSRRSSARWGRGPMSAARPAETNSRNATTAIVRTLILKPPSHAVIGAPGRRSGDIVSAAARALPSEKAEPRLRERTDGVSRLLLRVGLCRGDHRAQRRPLRGIRSPRVQGERELPAVGLENQPVGRIYFTVKPGSSSPAPTSHLSPLAPPFPTTSAFRSSPIMRMPRAVNRESSNS